MSFLNKIKNKQSIVILILVVVGTVAIIIFYNSLEELRLQNIKLPKDGILRIDNQGYEKVVFEKNINLGSEPSLKKLLSVSEEVVKTYWENDASLVGYVIIDREFDNKTPYWNIKFSYRTTHRYWSVDGNQEPVVLSVAYNSDIRKCIKTGDQMKKGCIDMESNNGVLIGTEIIDSSYYYKIYILPVTLEEIKLDTDTVLQKFGIANFDQLILSWSSLKKEEASLMWQLLYRESGFLKSTKALQLQDNFEATPESSKLP